MWGEFKFNQIYRLLNFICRNRSGLIVKFNVLIVQSRSAVEEIEWGKEETWKDDEEIQ